MPKRKPKDYSKLTPMQSEFICNKVSELGSVEAVKKHYDKKCLVDDFANKIVAKALFGKKGGRK